MMRKNNLHFEYYDSEFGVPSLSSSVQSCACHVLSAAVVVFHRAQPLLSTAHGNSTQQLLWQGMAAHTQHITIHTLCVD